MNALTPTPVLPTDTGDATVFTIDTVDFLPTDTALTEPGTEVEVEIYGKRYKATVEQDQPLWDPENERIRA